jgi:hypothetical protein
MQYNVQFERVDVGEKKCAVNFKAGWITAQIKIVNGVAQNKMFCSKYVKILNKVIGYSQTLRANSVKYMHLKDPIAIQYKMEGEDYICYLNWCSILEGG